MDPSPARRRRAVAVAGHTGDEAEVRRGLVDPAAEVRVSALSAAARLGMIGGVVLEDALSDPDPRVRHRAVLLVARRPGDQGPSLKPMLDSDDHTLVEAAAWASGERTPPEAGIVDHLVEVARAHDEALCREAAVAALGAIGDPAAVPAIIDALGDKPAVRRRAVIALAPFDGPEVERALATAREDKDWQTRQAAEDLS